MAIVNSLDYKKKQFLLETLKLSIGHRREISCLNEQETQNISDSLITKLYKDAISKYNGVDFGDIPDSKGDITKLKNYSNLTSSIEILKQISIKHPFDELDIVTQALQNIIQYKSSFEEGFVKDINFVVLTYNTITLTIVHAVSYLISIAVDFVKNPSYDTMTTVIRDVGKKEDYLSIKNLNSFNRMVTKGNLDKLFKSILSTKDSNFTGAVVSGAVIKSVVVTGMVISIIPLIRELIYQFYYMRVKFSDFCRVQAEFLESNIAYLSNDKHNKQVIKKQKKHIDNLNKISDMVKIKTNTSKAQTLKELNKKSYDLDELKSEINTINTNNIII